MPPPRALAQHATPRAVCAAPRGAQRGRVRGTVEGEAAMGAGALLKLAVSAAALAAPPPVQAAGCAAAAVVGVARAVAGRARGGSGGGDGAETLSAHVPVTLEWEGISAVITIKRKGEPEETRTVLGGARGAAAPGRLHAIMGPSGGACPCARGCVAPMRSDGRAHP